NRVADVTHGAATERAAEHIARLARKLEVLGTTGEDRFGPPAEHGSKRPKVIDHLLLVDARRHFVESIEDEEQSPHAVKGFEHREAPDVDSVLAKDEFGQERTDVLKSARILTEPDDERDPWPWKALLLRLPILLHTVVRVLEREPGFPGTDLAEQAEMFAIHVRQPLIDIRRNAVVSTLGLSDSSGIHLADSDRKRDVQAIDVGGL